MSILHRIEEYGDNHIEGPYLVLSFRTEYRGIWQGRWTAQGRHGIKGEPSFEMLTNKEQQAVEEIGAIVFYWTHGVIPKLK